MFKEIKNWLINFGKCKPVTNRPIIEIIGDKWLNRIEIIRSESGEDCFLGTDVDVTVNGKSDFLRYTNKPLLFTGTEFILYLNWRTFLNTRCGRGKSFGKYTDSNVDYLRNIYIPNVKWEEFPITIWYE